MKDELKSLFTSHWRYLAVNAACKIKLFDKIESNGTSSDDLVLLNKLNKTATEALLDICVQERLLKLEENKYLLTSKGEYLVSTHPENMYYACLNWGAEHLDAWKEMDYTINTGKSSFENIYREPFFGYIGNRPDKLDYYHKAMYAYAFDDYKNISEKLSIPNNEKVIDIAGGYGALISNLKKSRPDLDCAIFDLPEVIQNVYLTDITKYSGSFFDNIPTGYDHYILSRVIHDWDDEKALHIIGNIYKSLKRGGKMYLIENLTDRIQNKASLLTLNMLAICESHERSELEYLSILNHFDFETEIQQLNDNQFIIKATKK